MRRCAWRWRSLESASEHPHVVRAEANVDVVGEIADIEVIAVRSAIRGIRRLERLFGRGRWRKLKGTATARLENGQLRRVELHRYEAHGIGRWRLKIKRYLD